MENHPVLRGDNALGMLLLLCEISH
jgi:hypothetical protein